MTNLRPRRVEFGLVVMVSIVVVLACGLASLGRNAELPADIKPFLAVIVEAQPGADEQTGGRVAAPIAKAVIEAAFQVESEAELE